jgi:hypothetical protein
METITIKKHFQSKLIPCRSEISSGWKGKKLKISLINS